MVQPAEAAFSGFVFKIQANMDPKHRDRIAFFRVCSGRYTPGMKVKHVRLDREDETGQRADLHGQRAPADGRRRCRRHHRHPQPRQPAYRRLPQRRRGAGFKGIPYFSPELFRVARLRDPLKSKQLQKGLQELGEEGAIQVFETSASGALLLGAVGTLQFEVVAQRLQTEYKVDAIFESADIYTARWLTFPDEHAPQL
jgi:peptide chain release factor 3